MTGEHIFDVVASNTMYYLYVQLDRTIVALHVLRKMVFSIKSALLLKVKHTPGLCITKMHNSPKFEHI
jgi:hypothetical protein